MEATSLPTRPATTPRAVHSLTVFGVRVTQAGGEPFLIAGDAKTPLMITDCPTRADEQRRAKQVFYGPDARVEVVTIDIAATVRRATARDAV
jgi:hypothetical protein